MNSDLKELLASSWPQKRPPGLKHVDEDGWKQGKPLGDGYCLLRDFREGK